MTAPVVVHCPIEDPTALRQLQAGTPVRLSGTILTGRDAAHARLHDLIREGKPLPVDFTVFRQEGFRKNGVKFPEHGREFSVRAMF